METADVRQTRRNDAGIASVTPQADREATPVTRTTGRRTRTSQKRRDMPTSRLANQTRSSVKAEKLAKNPYPMEAGPQPRQTSTSMRGRVRTISTPPARPAFGTTS